MNTLLTNAILVKLLAAYGRPLTLSHGDIQVLATQDVRIENTVTGDGVRVSLIGNDIQVAARFAWQDLQAAKQAVRTAPPHARGQAMQNVELAGADYGKKLVLLAARGENAMTEHFRVRDVPVTEEEVMTAFRGE